MHWLLLFLFLLVGNAVVIHVVPHSHCDPGWLDTFEDYYMKKVKNILDNSFSAVKSDTQRRFIWAESSFFKRWYEDKSFETREEFKSLVRVGRWEFVGGGWSQNDEANPDYSAIINQMTQGHDYLLKTFGVVPKVGWQIDPFGHSSVTPALFALMGFDALVINRIHFSAKDYCKANKCMEFLWQGTDLGDESADMFTHVLHTHYSAPKGFDWEERDTPKLSSASIVEKRAAAYVAEIEKRSKAYATEHILVPFGDDFKFIAADTQFQNMDKIMASIKQRYPQHKIMYSTLSEYFSAVRNTKGIAYPSFTGDFFPYADNEQSYWTGYFTTRPLLKQASREIEATKRAAEVIYSLARARFQRSQVFPWDDSFALLEHAREESALFLHHDAITGTSRKKVVADYNSRLRGSSNELQSLMARLLGGLLSKSADPLAPGHLVHQTMQYDTIRYDYTIIGC